MHILGSPSQESLRKTLKCTGDAAFSWIYLGHDIAGFELSKKAFQDRGTLIDVTGRFHQAAEDLRDPYLHLIYDIGRNSNSLLWWVTSLSYRSRAVSKTFQQACFLRVAMDLIIAWTGPDNLVVICSDSPVRRALRINFDRSTLRAIDRTHQIPGRSFIDWGNLVFRRLFFLLREGRRLIQARRALPEAHIPKEPTTLIICSASSRNVHQGTEFHSLHFGDLVDRLLRMGHKVGVIPVVLRDVQYKTTLERIQSLSLPLMAPHRYLSFGDLLAAVVASLAKPRIPNPFPKLQGMNINPMAEEDLRSHWRSNRAADALLFSATLRRLAKANANIARIIYIYENQPWERALCWEANISMPRTDMIGYQHSRLPRNLLNYFQAPGGEETAPFPKYVVTNGPYSARTLTAGGFHPDRVKIGCAIQMGKQLASHSVNGQVSPSRTRPLILIAPSEEMEEAAELIGMGIDLFSPDDGVDVVLKCHPNMPFSRVAGFFEEELPSHVYLSDQPIADLFPISSLMVYTGSTVSVQALAMGLPVIHVRPRFDFDLDPLEGHHESRLAATGIDDLRCKVGWLLAHRKEYIEGHKNDWRHIVDDLYGPVTNESVEAFVA